MPLLLAALVLVQKSPAELAALRKYRYGETAARIEAMGRKAYERLFDAKNPPSGLTRGVAYAVYVDAYRENTALRYRASLPPNVQARLLALDKQIRFLGVLFARNDWLFTGGNAVDPDEDDFAYAEAERRLYTQAAGKPDPARTARRLEAYRRETRAKARRETLYGAMRGQAQGRREIDANLAKIDKALQRAAALCKTPHERFALDDFVANQALQRM